MMREIGIFDNYLNLIEALRGHGAFLVTGRDRPNPMTIGWATLGIIWGKPILSVLVRPSRHSFLLINSHEEFCVCVPPPSAMLKELIFCGTKSGRDFDKFAECGLSAEAGVKIKVPHIAECAMHYECKIVHKNYIISDKLDSVVQTQYYPHGDFHAIYYGEVQGAFLRE